MFEKLRTSVQTQTSSERPSADRGTAISHYLKSYLDLPAFSYSCLRTIHFTFQQKCLNFLISTPGQDTPHVDAYRDSILKLYANDSKNMREGYYPFSVLTPELPHHHAKRIPRILFDSLSIKLRKYGNKTKVFSKKAEDYLEGLPSYYARNFHFQTDGYLSEKSAELYEHQVETLFSGTADAMRRLFIRPLKDQLKGAPPSKLKILEVAIGTGRTTRFIRLAFPKAKITATDLSYPYLKFAQKRLKNFDRIDFLQADATRLPFNDSEFDVVVSVFLFHELPPEERRKTLQEAFRTLRPGGKIAFVDSVQKDDWHPANSALDQFPLDFHEPFYKHYVENPMEDELQKAGFKDIVTEIGFVSKTCVATKPG